MAAFNLTAQLNITGPNNLKPVISNIRKQLSSVTGTVNIKIDPKVTATANGLSQGLQNLNSSLVAISSSAKSAASAMGQFAAAMNSMNIKSVPRDMAAITQQSQKLQAQQAKTAATVTQSADSMVEFGKQSALAIRRFAAFTLVTGIIFKFTNSLGQASSEFMKFNSQLVQLSQVTGTSLKGLAGLEQTITGLSTSLGVSSSSLIDVSSTLAQAGLSARETEQALKALALSTLAPSFGDLNETVEGSIALMRQFSISTAQLEAALGSINSVAAKFAVEADDIIVAIQRTGGVFAAASKGVVEGSEALNQFIALFTSVRATTRESAETIATGLRTIFTRIQRSETIELLKRYGIQLTDLEGKFVGPYEAVKRLSMGLAGLDTRDIRFSAIIEELGGFRQVGKVIPLLQQFSTAEKALGVAQRGQTSLTGDAAKAQQALAIQMMKVQEEFVALVRSIGSSQQFQTMVKVALDLASALISIADASKHALPAIAGLLAVKGTIGAFRFASGFASGMRRGGGAAGLGERMSGAPRGYATGGQIRRYSGGTGRRGVEVALTPGEVVLNNVVGGIGRTLNRAADSPSVVKQFSPTKKSMGGNVSVVPGSGHGDIVRARLAEGGFVVKRQSVKALGGPENIAKIISNKYGIGGAVQAPISKLKTQSKGGPFIRQYQEKHSDVMQDLDMAESVKINRENISLTKQDFEYLKAKALRHDRNYSKKKGKKGTWSTFNKTVWAEGFEKIARKRKGAGWKRTARTGDYGGDSAPVDLINNNGEFAEVKFTHEDRPVSDIHLLNKLLRYKIMSSGDDPKRIGFTPKVGEEVRLGEITVLQPTNKDEFLQFFSPQNYKGKKKKRVNLGGIIQQFEDGGYVQKLGVGGKSRPKKEPFGTGLYPFPKRIQNAYLKQEQKRLQDEQFNVSANMPPRGERIVLDSAKIHEEYDKPFDREQFIKTFDTGVERSTLHGNIARLAKHIGLPKENLDDIVPQHIDFMGANTGGLGAFRRRSYGGRKAEEKYDLTKYGFSKGDEQDLFGYDKLIEEKTKQIRKILKTPVRTYDDGSFSYDAKAYDAVNQELLQLKNLRFKLSNKKSEAISLLTKEKEQIADSTGKGFISLSESAFGFGPSIKNKVLYHELTHQLFNSIRVKNPKAFEEYQKSVAGKLQDDSLADEFDSLPGFGYKSSDVAYGRSYKLSGLVSQRLSNKSAPPLAPEDQKYMASGLAHDMTKARDYKSHDARIESLLLTSGISQDVIDKYRQAGSEEFLTTLIEASPKLSGKLSSTLDSTLSELFGSAGIKRQRFAAGGRIQRFVNAGEVKERPSALLKSLDDRLARVGGIGGVKDLLGIPKGSRELDSKLRGLKGVTSEQMPEVSQILRKAEEAKILRVKGKISENRKKREEVDKSQQKGLLFAAVGLKGVKFAAIKKKVGKGILKKPVDVHITSGLLYEESAKKVEKTLAREYNRTNKKLAKEILVSGIMEDFNAGKTINLDFDRTLAVGADRILSDPTKPEFSEFADESKVQEVLSRKDTKLTKLGRALRRGIQQNPQMASNLRVVTARPQHTMPLIQEWLKKQGLPITDLQGVGGSGVSMSDIPKRKASVLKPGVFVDDDIENITEANQIPGMKTHHYKLKKQKKDSRREGAERGFALERIIEALGGPVSLRTKKSIDFPMGLMGAAKHFGVAPNIPTDAKRTLSGPSVIESNIVNYLKAKGYASGGVIQKLADGKRVTASGKLSRSPHKLVPPEKGVGPSPSVQSKQSAFTESQLGALQKEFGLKSWQLQGILERARMFEVKDISGLRKIAQEEEVRRIQKQSQKSDPKALAAFLMPNRRYGGGEIPFQPDQFFSGGGKIQRFGRGTKVRVDEDGRTREQFYADMVSKRKRPAVDEDGRTREEFYADMIRPRNLRRSYGGLIQKFPIGGAVKAVRRKAIIDSDKFRNIKDPEEAARVAEGMKLLGATTEADYAIKLSALAGQLRESGGLKRFSVMAGAAGNRKTSLAMGRGANDDAKLRQVKRKFVLHPSDLEDADEVTSLTTTLKQSKLDYMGKADRIYAKDSSTEDEQKLVKLFTQQRNTTKDATLFNREVGTTENLSPDYGEQTASLLSQFGSAHEKGSRKGKVVVLGEKTDKSGNPLYQTRIKRGEELPELVSAQAMTSMAASPFTRGHSEAVIGTMLEEARKKNPKATYKDLLVQLAPDLSLSGGSQGMEHGARYGIFPAYFRRELIKSVHPDIMVSSADKPSDTGINPRIAEIEKGISGRRRFAVAEQGAPVIISKAPHENPEGVMARYSEAGLSPKNIARTADEAGDSISGTAVRQAIVGKDYEKLDRAVLPQVSAALKANQPQIKNRSLMIPLVQQSIGNFVEANKNRVNEQINRILASASGGPFTRMTPKFKESHPDLVKQIQQLRKNRDIFEKEAYGDHAHEVIRQISNSHPDIYGLNIKRRGPTDVTVTENDIKQHIIDSSKLSTFFKSGLSFGSTKPDTASPIEEAIKQTVSSTPAPAKVKAKAPASAPKGSGDLPTDSKTIMRSLAGLSIPDEPKYGMFAGKSLDIDTIKKVWRKSYPQMAEEKTASYTAVKELLRQSYDAKPMKVGGRVKKFMRGGAVQKFSGGGEGEGNNVPALVSKGEGWVSPDQVSSFGGYSALHRLNHADKHDVSSSSLPVGSIGVFDGPGTGTSDSIGPVGLESGGFVIRAAAMEALRANRGGKIQRLASGGRVQKFAGGDAVLQRATSDLGFGRLQKAIIGIETILGKFSPRLQQSFGKLVLGINKLGQDADFAGSAMEVLSGKSDATKSKIEKNNQENKRGPLASYVVAQAAVDFGNRRGRNTPSAATYAQYERTKEAATANYVSRASSGIPARTGANPHYDNRTWDEKSHTTSSGEKFVPYTKSKPIEGARKDNLATNLYQGVKPKIIESLQRNNRTKAPVGSLEASYETASNIVQTHNEAFEKSKNELGVRHITDKKQKSKAISKAKKQANQAVRDKLGAPISNADLSDLISGSQKIVQNQKDLDERARLGRVATVKDSIENKAKPQTPKGYNSGMRYYAKKAKEINTGSLAGIGPKSTVLSEAQNYVEQRNQGAVQRGYSDYGAYLEDKAKKTKSHTKLADIRKKQERFTASNAIIQREQQKKEQTKTGGVIPQEASQREREFFNRRGSQVGAVDAVGLARANKRKAAAAQTVKKEKKYIEKVGGPLPTGQFSYGGSSGQANAANATSVSRTLAERREAYFQKTGKRLPGYVETGPAPSAPKPMSEKGRNIVERKAAPGLFSGDLRIEGVEAKDVGGLTVEEHTEMQRSSRRQRKSLKKDKKGRVLRKEVVGADRIQGSKDALIEAQREPQRIIESNATATVANDIQNKNNAESQARMAEQQRILQNRDQKRQRTGFSARSVMNSVIGGASTGAALGVMSGGLGVLPGAAMGAASGLVTGTLGAASPVLRKYGNSRMALGQEKLDSVSFKTQSTKALSGQKTLGLTGAIGTQLTGGFTKALGSASIAVANFGSAITKSNVKSSLFNLFSSAGGGIKGLMANFVGLQRTIIATDGALKGMTKGQAQKALKEGKITKDQYNEAFGRGGKSKAVYHSSKDKIPDINADFERRQRSAAARSAAQTKRQAYTDAGLIRTPEQKNAARGITTPLSSADIKAREQAVLSSNPRLQQLMNRTQMRHIDNKLNGGTTPTGGPPMPPMGFPMGGGGGPPGGRPPKGGSGGGRRGRTPAPTSHPPEAPGQQGGMGGMGMYMGEMALSMAGSVAAEQYAKGLGGDKTLEGRLASHMGGSVVTGASTGMMMGSMIGGAIGTAIPIPVLGTMTGAVVGGAIGTGVGALGGGLYGMATQDEIKDQFHSEKRAEKSAKAQEKMASSLGRMRDTNLSTATRTEARKNVMESFNTISQVGEEEQKAGLKKKRTWGEFASGKGWLTSGKGSMYDRIGKSASLIGLGWEAKDVTYSGDSAKTDKERAEAAQPLAESAKTVLAAEIERTGKGLKELESSMPKAEFDKLSRAIALSDEGYQALESAAKKQIEQIKNSGDSEEQKKQKIDQINATLARQQGMAVERQTAELKAKEEAEKTARANAKLQQAMQKVIVSFEKMANALDSAAARANKVMENAKLGIDAIDNPMAAVQQGQISKSTDILSNPNAYSIQEVEDAARQNAGMAGSSSEAMVQAAVLPRKLEKGFGEAMAEARSGNKTDTEARSSVKEAMGKAVQDAFGPEIADDMKKEIDKFVNEFKGDITQLNFDELIKGIPGLADKMAASGKVMEALKSQAQAAANAIAMMGDAASKRAAKGQEMRNMDADTFSTVANSTLAFRRGTGEKISWQADAGVRNQARAIRLGTTADVAADPRKMLDRYNKLKEAKDQAVTNQQQVAEANRPAMMGKDTSVNDRQQAISNIDGATRATAELAQSMQQARDEIKALPGDIKENISGIMQELQDAMQERNAKIGSASGFMEKMLTSTPQGLKEMGNTFNNLNRTLSGNSVSFEESYSANKAYNQVRKQGGSHNQAQRAAQEAYAQETSQEISMAKELAPLLGAVDPAAQNKMMASVYENMFKARGQDPSKMMVGGKSMQEYLDMMKKGPAEDPKIAALKQALESQQSALQAANDAAKELIAQEAEALTTKTNQAVLDAMTAGAAAVKVAVEEAFKSGIGMPGGKPGEAAQSPMTKEQIDSKVKENETAIQEAKKVADNGTDEEKAKAKRTILEKEQENAVLKGDSKGRKDLASSADSMTYEEHKLPGETAEQFINRRDKLKKQIEGTPGTPASQPTSGTQAQNAAAGNQAANPSTTTTSPPIGSQSNNAGTTQPVPVSAVGAQTTAAANQTSMPSTQVYGNSNTTTTQKDETLAADRKSFEEEKKAQEDKVSSAHSAAMQANKDAHDADVEYNKSQHYTEEETEAGLMPHGRIVQSDPAKKAKQEELEKKREARIAEAKQKKEDADKKSTEAQTTYINESKSQEQWTKDNEGRQSDIKQREEAERKRVQLEEDRRLVSTGEFSAEDRLFGANTAMYGHPSSSGYMKEANEDKALKEKVTRGEALTSEEQSKYDNYRRKEKEYYDNRMASARANVEATGTGASAPQPAQIPTSATTAQTAATGNQAAAPGQQPKPQQGGRVVDNNNPNVVVASNPNAVNTPDDVTFGNAQTPAQQAQAKKDANPTPQSYKNLEDERKAAAAQGQAATQAVGINGPPKPAAPVAAATQAATPKPVAMSEEGKKALRKKNDLGGLLAIHKEAAEADATGFTDKLGADGKRLTNQQVYEQTQARYDQASTDYKKAQDAHYATPEGKLFKEKKDKSDARNKRNSLGMQVSSYKKAADEDPTGDSGKTDEKGKMLTNKELYDQKSAELKKMQNDYNNTPEGQARKQASDLKKEENERLALTWDIGDYRKEAKENAGGTNLDPEGKKTNKEFLDEKEARLSELKARNERRKKGLPAEEPPTATEAKAEAEAQTETVPEATDQEAIDFFNPPTSAVGAQTTAEAVAASSPTADTTASDIAAIKEAGPAFAADAAAGVTPQQLATETEANPKPEVSAEQQQNTAPTTEAGTTAQTTAASTTASTPTPTTASGTTEKAPEKRPGPMGLANVHQEAQMRGMTAEEVNYERQQQYLSQFNPETRAAKEKSMGRGLLKPSERQLQEAQNQRAAAQAGQAPQQPGAVPPAGQTPATTAPTQSTTGQTVPQTAPASSTGSAAYTPPSSTGAPVSAPRPLDQGGGQQNQGGGVLNTSGLEAFAGKLDTLLTKLGEVNIPTEIRLTSENLGVNVTLNGGEVMANLPEQLKNNILAQAGEQLRKYDQASSGEGITGKSGIIGGGSTHA